MVAQTPSLEIVRKAEKGGERRRKAAELRMTKPVDSSSNHAFPTAPGPSGESSGTHFSCSMSNFDHASILDWSSGIRLKERAYVRSWATDTPGANEQWCLDFRHLFRSAGLPCQRVPTRELLIDGHDRNR